MDNERKNELVKLGKLIFVKLKEIGLIVLTMIDLIELDEED